MSAEDFFDKKHPKSEYRDDGWVTSYETWRKEIIEFAKEYANQEVKKALNKTVTNEDWEKLRNKALDNKLERW